LTESVNANLNPVCKQNLPKIANETAVVPNHSHFSTFRISLENIIPLQLFENWRHTLYTLRFRLLHDHRQTEVSNLHFSMVPIDENVITLQVPVYDWWLLAVQIGQPCQYLFSPSPNRFHVDSLVLRTVSKKNV
jgi:hypothetical protein